MGIRFKCPNGHVLHVKNFLAGKKGVCPDCGARMRIPPESDPTLAKNKDGKDDDEKDVSDHEGELPPLPLPAAIPPLAATVSPVANVPSPAAVSAIPNPVSGVIPAAVMPTAASVVPAAVPVAAVPVTAVPVSAIPVVPAAIPAAVPGAVATVMPVNPAVVAPGVAAAPARPAFSAAGPLPPGLVSPLAESPNALWYVRPAAGGQFGPARGDVVRQWIGEGRLAGDSLVWREGWADWKSAPEVFPELAGAGVSVAGPGLPFDANSSARTADYLARKRSGNSMAIFMMIMLGVICIGLMIVLAYILTQNSKPKAAGHRPQHAAVFYRSVPVQPWG